MVDLSGLDDNAVRQRWRQAARELHQAARELMHRQRRDQQPLTWYLPPWDARTHIQFDVRRGGRVRLTMNHLTPLAELGTGDQYNLIAWLIDQLPDQVGDVAGGS